MIDGLLNLDGEPMRSVLSATEARVHFGELLRRVVEDGEVVTVERSGKPLAVVISVTEYEALQRAWRERNPEPDWWELTERSRATFRKHFEGRPIPDIDRLFDEMRDERDEQLLAGVLAFSEQSSTNAGEPAE